MLNRFFNCEQPFVGANSARIVLRPLYWCAFRGISPGRGLDAFCRPESVRNVAGDISWDCRNSTWVIG